MTSWDVMDDIDPEGRPEHGEEAGVSFENCRALRASDKALLVRVKGAERWVPKSQIHEDSEVYENGHEGKLVISQWLADKWDEEKASITKRAELYEKRNDEPPVSVHDVVCLRESAKAILVRCGADGDETWVPKTQVSPDSQVQGDGDAGTLIISAWIAKQKPELVSK